jgi:hypothetical protein
MKRFIWTAFSLVLLCAPQLLYAQKTSPPKKTAVNRDSLRIPAPLVVPSGHTLPPSILAELRRSQTKRTIAYYDTLRASDLARLHPDDSEGTYSDSALTILDTAVSLSHKEWIDSELVEIPELVRFGTHLHFNYPVAIMTEPERRPVPFDSTLVEGMNPVTRENLPFFDQSPIPMPLRESQPAEAMVELGGGNIYQPIGKAWGAYTISPRTSVQGSVDFRSRSDVPVKSYLNADLALNASLGPDPSMELYHGVDLRANLGYSSKDVLIISDRIFPLFHIGASLDGNTSDRFHYDINALDREFSENSGLFSESSQDIQAGFHYDPYISHFRFIGEAGYSDASERLDTIPNFSVSNSISAEHVELLFGRRKGGDIEWYGGITYMGGSGLANATYSSLLPIARVRIPFNARWEFGGSFEPQIQLASQVALSQINPFYLPSFTTQDTAIGHAVDSRSIVMDKINLSAFMNYTLAPDDELRLEAHFITRDREPIFQARSLNASQTVFTVTPMSTRRLQFSAAGNFLLFTRDVLSGDVQVSSATTTADDRAIPFEPTMKFSAAYHFNSISDAVLPSVEFRSIGRTGKTLTFLDAEARIAISQPLSIFLRAENILGGPSDFWTGYPESPRSFWASARYVF